MSTLLVLMNYGLLLIFGVVLSVFFAGVTNNRKNRRSMSIFIISLLLLQLTAWQFLGYDITRKIYPFIVHLPLSIYIRIKFKQSWRRAFICVLSAYLCCQTPRWFATMALYLFNNQLAYLIVNSLTIFPVFYIMMKHVIPSVNALMNLSKRSLKLFGIVPLMYYVFDYTTTVYTHLLYQGIEIAVIFMPTIVSMLYFVFVILYYNEMQKRSEAEKERMMLSAQIQQAKMELCAFQEMQKKTTIYRHDMRHHLNLIRGYIVENASQKALDYINITQSDIEGFTPVRYCENSTINLILSYFASKAKGRDISFKAEAAIMEDISIQENDICALLSNGLENALEASAQSKEKMERFVRINCQIHKCNLLIFIENNFSGELEMKDGLPQNHREGHGFGVKSMQMITNKYQGFSSYTALDGLFTLRIVLPL